MSQQSKFLSAIFMMNVRPGGDDGFGSWDASDHPIAPSKEQKCMRCLIERTHRVADRAYPLLSREILIHTSRMHLEVAQTECQVTDKYILTCDA